jgi:hypothetical protein
MRAERPDPVEVLVGFASLTASFEGNKGRRSGAPCFWFRYRVRYEPPRMSLLPNVAGQSVFTAGGGTEPPVWKDCRKASIAGQSAASRTSFQTAAPYVFVATA